jgi:hypothetical protein
LHAEEGGKKLHFVFAYKMANLATELPNVPDY